MKRLREKKVQRKVEGQQNNRLQGVIYVNDLRSEGCVQYGAAAGAGKSSLANSFPEKYTNQQL